VVIGDWSATTTPLIYLEPYNYLLYMDTTHFNSFQLISTHFNSFQLNSVVCFMEMHTNKVIMIQQINIMSSNNTNKQQTTVVCLYDKKSLISMNMLFSQF